MIVSQMSPVKFTFREHDVVGKLTHSQLYEIFASLALLTPLEFRNFLGPYAFPELLLLITVGHVVMAHFQETLNPKSLPISSFPQSVFAASRTSLIPLVLMGQIHQFGCMTWLITQRSMQSVDARATRLGCRPSYWRMS